MERSRAGCRFLNRVGFLLALYFSSSVSGGALVEPPGSTGAASEDRFVVQVHDHEVVHVAKVGGRTVAVTEVGPEGEADFLIELEEPPLLADKSLRSQAPGALAALRSQRRQTLERLSETVVALENRVRGRRGLAAVADKIVHRSYINVFHGLAVRISGETADALRELPEVRRVVPDREMRALLDQSVVQIGADRVWNELGATGQGVTVAVIDSGIDYTHPDLGGCLGIGCKVIGGYDFIDDDADPMDDHGHGTHVAGIVAANGLVKGVAPDSRLLAYKVLSSLGTGTSSLVIAALDRAVDPDGDPATDDAPDVINLSLGGSPGATSDDPVSQAADMAVEAGIVVVAGTGNEGPGYGTVTSPATGRRVLAVGAADASDGVANFSSRGPVPFTYDLKPDLTAPGVGIRSTVPTGSCSLCDPSGYKVEQGTSAASPHVAGAAALLRQLFPSWTAQQIAAGLTGRTATLPFDVFTVGSGRLDAYAAATAVALASPVKLALGPADLTPPSSTLLATVTVANPTSQSGSYDFSVTEGLPPGVDATVTTASVFLGPGASQTVDLEILIDNLTVPNVADPPHAYDAALEISGPGGVLHRVPFAFLKIPILELQFDQSPSGVSVFDTDKKVASAFFPGTKSEFPLPEGTYDVVTSFAGSHLVFREGMPLTDRTVLNIAKAEANHPVTLNVLDENGDPLSAAAAAPPTLGTAVVKHRASNAGLVIFSTLGSPFWLSDVSGAYLFELGMFVRGLESGPDYTFLTHLGEGIDGPIQLTNEPANFKRVVLQHHPDPGLEEVGAKESLQIHGVGLNGEATLCAFTNLPLKAPFTQETFSTPPPYPEFSLGYLIHTVHRNVDSVCQFTQNDVLYRTPLFRVQDLEHVQTFLGHPSRPFLLTGAETLPVGIGPPVWRGHFGNRPDLVFLFPEELFLSPLGGERFPSQIPWELFQGGALVETGAFRLLDTDPFSVFSGLIPVAPGAYELHINYSGFFVGGQPGVAEVEAVFDTTAFDGSPPYLERYEVLATGTWVDSLPAGGAQLAFSVQDDQSPVGPVFVTLDTGNGKVPLAVTPLGGGAYVATIPPHDSPRADPPVMASLELVAEDGFGNRLTYRVGLPLKPDPNIFADGFESGDLSAWWSVGPP